MDDCIICFTCKNPYCDKNAFFCWDCDNIICHICLEKQEEIMKEYVHYGMVPKGDKNRLYCEVCWNYKQIKFIDEFTIYKEKNKEKYSLLKMKNSKKLIVSFDDFNYKLAIINTSKIKLLDHTKISNNIINVILKFL
jgi:hypothetical protein